jgi:hypothetical protein
MRSIFFTIMLTNMVENITGQIEELNKLVLDYAIHIVTWICGIFKIYTRSVNFSSSTRTWKPIDRDFLKLEPKASGFSNYIKYNIYALYIHTYSTYIIDEFYQFLIKFHIVLNKEQTEIYILSRTNRSCVEMGWNIINLLLVEMIPGISKAMRYFTDIWTPKSKVIVINNIKIVVYFTIFFLNHIKLI